MSNRSTPSSSGLPAGPDQDEPKNGLYPPKSDWPSAREIDRRRFVTGSAAAIALFALGCRDDTIVAPSRGLRPGGRSLTFSPGTAYSYRRTITIDHTKVSASQTNFTVAIAGTLASLATVANGGKVVSSSGYDIAFFSDSALTIPLAFERALYTPTTGKHAFWVKVPSLSSTADTVIYMVYGGSTVTTDQQDRTNAWDSSYVEVHNFGDGSAFDGSDSTSNGRNLTNHNSTATTDAIDGAISTGDDKCAERVASNPPFTGYGINATLESVFTPSETTSTGVIVAVTASINTTPMFELTKVAGGALRATFGAGAGGLNTSVDTTALYTASAINYGAAVFQGNSNRSVYLNGTAGVQSTVYVMDGAVPNTIAVGCRYGGGMRASAFAGSIGQVRISNVVRSASWISTVDASTRGLATFYSLGSETTLGTPSPYANAGTDGTDPGCAIAAKNAQTAIAKSGDRRSATRTLYSGSYEGAAYPANWNSINYPSEFGTVRVVSGATPAARATSLQSAINAAVPGDVIELPAGAANKISGSFTLPVKSGADTTPGGNNVVTIRVANAATNLPYGVRVVSANQATRTGLTATNVSLLAHVELSVGGGVALFDTTTTAASGYRFVGLRCYPASTVTGQISRLFRIGTGNNTQNTDAGTPKNIVIDRCLVEDPRNDNMLHALDFQAANSIIIDSDISNIKNNGSGDCQALVAYNTNGRLSYINSYFEATDECLADGGSDNSVGSLVDVEHRWCVFGKQDSWNPAHPSYAGTAWSIKLSAEIKHGQRSFWEGCWFVGCWSGNQNGDGLNIKNEYNEAGGTHTADIIVRYCDFEKLDSGVRIAGGTYAPDNFAIRRVVVAHNVMKEVGTGYYSSGTHGYVVQTQAVEDLHVVHNTCFTSRLVHYILQGGASDTNGLTNGLVHRDNIYGPVSFDRFRGGGTGDGKPSIDTWAPGGQLHGNVIVGANSANYTGTTLSGNFFPSTVTAVGFTDYANGDYSLRH